MTQVLKDKHGDKIGEIKEKSGIYILYDKRGNQSGHYDQKKNKTYDKRGNLVGTGNLLVTLL